MTHDLPPRWDGYEVTWADKWEQELTSSLPGHLPDLGACEECGSIRLPLNKWGTYWSRGVRLKASPLPGPHKHHARRIMATRCIDCWHTTVTETGRSGQHWVLGPEDYTDAGSYDVEQSQGSLF